MSSPKKGFWDVFQMTKRFLLLTLTKDFRVVVAWEYSMAMLLNKSDFFRKSCFIAEMGIVYYLPARQVFLLFCVRKSAIPESCQMDKKPFLRWKMEMGSPHEMLLKLQALLKIWQLL